MSLQSPEITYFYSPGACSLPVHILIEQVGLPCCFERISLKDDAQHTAAYKAINAHGRLPSLRHGELTVTESLAIATYLDAITPSANILPNDPVEIARLFELLSFFITTVQPCFAQFWRPERYVQDCRAQAIVKKAIFYLLPPYFQRLEQIAERTKKDRPDLSDFYLMMFYRWGCRARFDLTEYRHWRALSTGLLEYQFVRTALDREGIWPEPFSSA